ncbi:MAG: flagellar biosynthetic protein FliR [Myxococcales bacterium]|nr:flagellar biosynthetic protein FliR [Myxococcales bacterium]
MIEQTLVTGMLVFVRMATVIAGLPIFSTQGAPRQAVLLFGLATSLVITPTLPVVALPTHLAGFVAVLGLEILYGVLLVLGVRATFSVVNLAGELMGLQMGLAMATLFDPLQRERSSALGTLAAWLSGMAFLGTGLHLRVVELLGSSFHLVPPGQLAVGPELVPALVATVGAHFSMGVQLAGPLLALVFIVNVLMAVLARLAPRMNVFFAIGLSANIVIGLMLMWLSMPWFIMAHHSWLERSVAELGRLLGV